MLTHVITTLLLIGSLAAGVTCFTWSGGPEPNSTVRPCPGSNVTLDWTFSLSDKDRLLSVQWFLVQASTTQKAVGFVSPSGAFFKVPDIKTRVEFLPPAGLRLYNVSTRDLGTYTVSVALFRPGGPDFRQRSVTLALPEKPYLHEGRLVASLEPRTVTVNGTSHARLSCGTILNHQDANFSVVWKTPGGQTVPSSGHQDGVFHLLLVNPVEGGAYHCHLHGVTSLNCQHNGTQSSAGRVEVDRLQTQLMVLEASAARHDRQLLHANYGGSDLAASLEREANVSLEVRAALDGLQARTQSLDTVDTELRNLTAEHTQQLNAMDTELANMKAEHEQQLNTLDKRMDTVNTELSNFTAEYTQQLYGLDKRLDTVDTKLSNLAAEHTQQLSTLDKRLDTVDTELSNMKIEHKQQLNTLEKHLTARIDQLTDTVGLQEQVIANLTALLEKQPETDKASDSEPEELARNCLESRQTHPHSGIQTIHVAGNSIPVYCDQTTDGGGWTLIQRRQDGSVDFYRNWTQYENGFGDVSREFWLGLRTIHEMTTSGSYSLRVDLWDMSGTHVYARYSSFYIGGPADNYRLHLGGYSGTAGDSMVNTGSSSRVANNMAFSTYDRDNDLYSGNCASSWHGAWWYNSCHHSNLNGQYYADGRQDSKGISWYRYKNDERSFTRAEMKIRPVNN